MKEAFVTLPVLRHSGVALVSFIYEERTPKVTTPAVCHQGEGKKGRQGERERERKREREIHKEKENRNKRSAERVCRRDIRESKIYKGKREREAYNSSQQ